MSKRLVPILDVDADRMTPVDYMLPPVGQSVDWKAGAWTPTDDLHDAFESEELSVVEEIRPVFIPERLKTGFGMLAMAALG